MSAMAEVYAEQMEAQYPDDPFEGMSDEQEAEARRQMAAEQAYIEERWQWGEELEAQLTGEGTVSAMFGLDAEQECRDRELAA